MTQDDMPRTVRGLLRALDRASLATNLPGEPAAWPYASLVLVAVDHDLSPILLLSDLAEHAKAIAVDEVEPVDDEAPEPAAEAATE